MYKIGLVCAALAAGPAAQAAVVVLTFEGAGDYTLLTNEYAGLGVVFGQDQFGGYALTAVNIAGGGLSEFYNQPSGNTIMGFTVPVGVVNVPLGFDIGFSFFYSTASVSSKVTAYGGLDGTGAVLGSVGLPAQLDRGCIAAQRGTACNWTPSGFRFAGLARSLVFSDPEVITGFDNLTFGSAIPVGVPEPAPLAALGIGLASMGIARRRNPRS